MFPIRIDGYRDFFREGEQFLAAALGAHRKGKASFTPEILYNLTAMAVEKYLMAFLMSRGRLAENHTMADLLRNVEETAGPLDRELAAGLLHLDSFQEICQLDTYRRTPPLPTEIPRILAIGEMVRLFVTPRLAC